MWDYLTYDSVSGAFIGNQFNMKANLGSSIGEELEAHMTRGRSSDHGGKFHGKSQVCSKNYMKGHDGKMACWSCGEIGYLKKDCKRRSKFEKGSS